MVTPLGGGGAGISIVSKSLSPDRYASLGDPGELSKGLKERRAFPAANRARAVLLLVELDAELRKAMSWVCLLR